MRFLNLALTFFFVFQTSLVFAQDQAASAAGGASSGSAPDPKAAPIPPMQFLSNVGQGNSKMVTTEIQACNSSAETARNYCLSNLNPKIQTASGMIGVLLSGAAALKSTSESCQKYNQALKIAEMALTAYNGMCSAAQMNCQSTCDDSKKEVDRVRAIIEPVSKTDAAGVTAAEANFAKLDLQNLDQNIRPVIARKLNVCEGYKMNLAAAGVGLMNIIKQSSLSSTCTDATTVADCSKNPNTPACLAAAGQVDCSKPENQSNTQCVCQRAPNTAGCPGAIGQSGVMPAGGSGSLSGQSADKITPPSTSGADSNALGAGGGAGSAAGGSLAGGGAGGGGGGGLGSNGQNKTGAADGKDKKSLNPNILSGYDGGGGGGGRGGGSGSAANSAYNAYLPGGAKDPSRGLASKTFGNGEVTGAGSKSNWEKVSERYKDNKPTLMGP